MFGGAEGDRTPDLVVANDALSQLSYGPLCNYVAPDIDAVKPGPILRVCQVYHQKMCRITRARRDWNGWCRVLRC